MWLAALGALVLLGTLPEVRLPRTAVLELTCPDNQVRYRLDVALPRSLVAAREPDRRFPLLLVLDSDYAFAIARNVVEHLSDRGDLPEMVVAGVGYAGSATRHQYRLHRSRDYTPTRSATGGYGPEYQAFSGGAKMFRRCLDKVLLPALAANFATGRPRVLSGHSYGGLFTADTLLRRPAMFDGYLMVSPSLWYDDQLPVKRLSSHADWLRPRLQAKVYGGVGALEINAQWGMPQELALFDTRLRALQAPGLCLKTETLDDETHNSVYPRALSNGLRFLWARRDAVAAFSPCPHTR